MIKSAGLAILGSSLMTEWRVKKLYRSTHLTILNLHRVDGNKNSAYEAISPALFEELVLWLKARFEILTFAELENWKAGSKPPLILSFDDGYKDFIEYVVPILEKHRLRANQNIIPGCVESGKPPMNVILQDFIGAAPESLLKEIKLPGLPEGADTRNRVNSGIRASAALKNQPIRKQQAIFDRLLPQFERFDNFRTTPLMSREEISQVSSVHEIGAHSYDHASMKAESQTYFVEDLERCNSYFKKQLGVSPKIYAFPNGSCRDGQTELARRAGYENVLLVGEGFSTTRAKSHNRFTMYGSKGNELRFRATGGLKKISELEIR